MAFFGEFVEFLKYKKKLWLLPVLIVVGLVAVLVLVAGNPTIAPFIYTLF